MSVEVLPAASEAVMIMTFVPIFSEILATDQPAVPIAVPLVPLVVFAHITLVTPTLSVAVPVSLTLDDLVL